jgi:hypothetical protein
MTAISIAVGWLVVGLVVAAAFGAAVRRTRWEQDGEGIPEKRGATLQYLRKHKNDDCQIARGMSIVGAKKQATKRRVAA